MPDGTGWPFIAYESWFHDEPDGEAERVYIPASLSETEALADGRRWIDGEDAMGRSYVLRISGKSRWRESTTVENKIAARDEYQSVMLPAKRAGHEYWEIDVIPIKRTALEPAA